MYILIIIFILSVLYSLSTFKFNYWKKKKVPYTKPVPLFGNYMDYILLRKYQGDIAKDLCLKFPNVPYFGTFYGTEPTLMVRDPEYIRLVMTKDFYYFSGREISKYTHNEVFTTNIFFSGGDRWRVVRQNLTPVFSPSKMRSIFYLLVKCGQQFEQLLDENFTKSHQLEARSIMAKYTMGCIGSCAFGIDIHTMTTGEYNVFEKIGKEIFSNNNYRGFMLIARAIWPALFYGLKMKTFPEKIDKFFHNLLVDIFKSRGYKPSSRNDFVDWILNFKANEYITGDSLTNWKDGGNRKVKVLVDDELLVAQCVTMFAGGFETSATTLSFALYELAKNQEAQRLAQQEVDKFLENHNNCIKYDNLNELVYLDACLDETLRIYPLLGVITREVIEDYTFPSGLQVDKGVRVHIPVYYLQHSPDYFPEPEKFKPERFLPENRNQIKPYTYLPFGEGPRTCIGIRFAKMQMLVGMVTLLKKYHVELALGMPYSVDLDPRTLATQANMDIRLKLDVRQGWEKRMLNKIHQ